MDDDDDNYPGKLLHQAALYHNVDLLKDLLTGDEIKNIDATDRFGCTPLHTACLSAAQATTENDTKILDSSLEFIMVLIDHGADLNIQTGDHYNNRTPLHIIAEVGNEKILALLLFHKADVTIRDKLGYTPLILAQINRQVDTVEMIQNEIELRQQVQQETEKRLLDACFDGDVVKAEECLAQLGAHAKAVLNASPNGSDTLNYLHRACRTGNVDLVQLLLKHGAIAKPHRETSYSPLYIACRIGNLEIVELLMMHFPHLVSVATLEQILPFAAACSQGHLAIIQLLLTYPNYPLTSCQIFIDRLQRSYIFPFNLNAHDINDQTGLYLAAFGGHVDLVEYLLSFRLSALTPHDLDRLKRRSTSTDSIATLADFNATLDKTHVLFNPFNLDIYANTGRTALHEAIEQQNFKLVHLLVSNGANVNLPYEDVASRSNNENQCFVTRSTPLSAACRLGNSQLIDYLLNALATDKDFLAYHACKSSVLIGHLLKHRALQDKEFKLSKRQLTSQALYQFTEQFWSTIDWNKIWAIKTDEKKDDNNNTIATGSNAESNYSMESTLRRRSSKRYQILTTSFEQIRNNFSLRRSWNPSNLSTASSSSSPSSTLTNSFSIPSVPVGIQWHHYGPLKTLDPIWFLQASIFVNKETFTQLSDITPSNRHLLLHCITRIDLSNNALENLPSFLFQMYSLRILNVAHNQIGDLPQDLNTWLCHQLVELDISHNALLTLPAALFQLRSLQRAYAANNQLQYLPVEMWSAPMLTDLNVSNNALKDLPIPSQISTRSSEKSSRRHMSSRHGANSARTASEYRAPPPPSFPSSITTVNLAQSPLPPPIPPRSTTMAQIATDDIPPSPDDDDELERRSKLKLTYSSTPPSSAASSTPVQRLCLWQNHIAPSTVDEPPAPASTTSASPSVSSRLTNLNLSHNFFEILPPMLSCLTPYLTTLNLSYNQISDPSCIASYPPRLKTLDLSSNRLQSCLLVEYRKDKSSRRHRNADTTDSICYRPELKDNHVTIDAVKRRRSRSVSRHKVLASNNLSLGSNAMNQSDQNNQLCPHRRHMKLEHLHDLNLSDNQIREVILSSIPKSPSEIDGNLYRSSLLFPAITRLNLAKNELVSIPSSVAFHDNLATLILRDNFDLKQIPLSIGSMQKLWNLDLHGCGR